MEVVNKAYFFLASQLFINFSLEDLINCCKFLYSCMTMSTMHKVEVTQYKFSGREYSVIIPTNFMYLTLHEVWTVDEVTHQDLFSGQG